MAENGSGVELNTGLFGLRLVGANALWIFLFLMIILSMALTIWEHTIRSDEHEKMVCTIRLNLYVNSRPRGQPVDWSDMPADLYTCVPRFLYERPIRPS